MSKLIQELERRIAKQVIEDLLAAGYTVSVHDGDEITVDQSSDPAAILAAMFTTDEDRLYANKDGRRNIGWIQFIYGNEGWDVISDHTMNLESILANATAISDEYA